MTIKLPDYATAQVPPAPNSIEKGVPLKDVINQTSIEYLARNILLADPEFDAERFYQLAVKDFTELTLMARGAHIADALFEAFQRPYHLAIEVLLASLTEVAEENESSGLSGFFYLPHSCFIAQYGTLKQYNEGQDPFDISMQAQYQLTQRFTAEFCIRPFLIAQQSRTLEVLNGWLGDTSRHVRRLCSEGTRPKLPWGKRLPAIIADPTPVIPILEALKDDESLYVRRSVANHLGDIAKDHPDVVLDICERWLKGASADRKWLIRHALRYPSKKGNERAQHLRIEAK